ncbi:MAG: hypothetical protein WD771_09000 [Gemmatimonadaceae bacterium]
MSHSPPPFAPEPARFPCPGLLALAVRSAVGGARESLLGALVAARLAASLRGAHPLPVAARTLRAEGARTWLGALTVPAKVRVALQRSFAATAGADLGAAADALTQVTDVTAAHLDRVARSELVRLADGLRADAAALAGAPHRAVE